jgi:broad specificity phosphatase PhoE
VRILLVRHGQSEWNAMGRWQGWADPPLSELGRRQSVLAGQDLEGIDVAVSSDLRRAVDTAALMAEPLGLSAVAVEPRLRERDVGEWTGLRRREIEGRWPEALAAMTDPPGGESVTTLQERVLAAVVALARTYPDSAVLAVTHGGVIRSLERQLGVDPDPLPNLGGAWLEVSADATMAVGPRVLLVDHTKVPVTVPRQL